MSAPARTPSNRCMPVAEWPPLVRAAWTAALAHAEGPDRSSIMAHWSAGTRRMVAGGHGRWLTWRAERGLNGATTAPGDDVIPECLEWYVTDLRKTLAEYTVAARVEQLGNAMRIIAPARSWRWLQRAADRIRAGARASRDAARPGSPDCPRGDPEPVTKPNRCVPFAEWPALDRMAWDAALRPGDLLDTGGVADRWAPRTLATVIDGYGRWLTWLSMTGALDPLVAPEARMTRPRIRAFVAALETEVAPFTIAGRIEQVGNAMRAMAPGVDWRWIQRAASRLRAEAVPVRDKRSRLRSPEELVACGMALMARADDPASGSPNARAVLHRDGLMIALLAHRPMRAKNAISIVSGGHLTLRGTTWWVVFPAPEMKTQRAPLEFPFPGALAPGLRRYLEVHRAVLLEAADQTGAPVTALWMSKDGRALGYAAMAHQVRKHTKAAFGLSLSPHLFRDAMATAIAINVPAEVWLIMPVLSHTTLKTSARHYDQAGTLEAGRRQAGNIAALRRRTRTPPGRVP